MHQIKSKNLALYVISIVFFIPKCIQSVSMLMKEYFTLIKMIFSKQKPVNWYIRRYVL